MGIDKNVTSPLNFYHTHVYIGGTGVGGSASNTQAFKFSTHATTATDVVSNNILVNARSNASSGSNGHYAFEMSATANLSLDYNIYSNYNTSLSAKGTNSHLFKYAAFPKGMGCLFGSRLLVSGAQTITPGMVIQILSLLQRPLPIFISTLQHLPRAEVYLLPA